MDPQEEDLILPIAPISSTELETLDPNLNLVAEEILDELLLFGGQEQQVQPPIRQPHHHAKLAKKPQDHWCGVCGRRAAGSRYYGGLVCYGCRAFFKRSCADEGQRYREFVCREGGMRCDAGGKLDCRYVDYLTYKLI